MVFYLFFIRNFGICYIQPPTFEGPGKCHILWWHPLFLDGYIGDLSKEISLR